MSDWTITFHTVNFDGSAPSDDGYGHDWSISFKGVAILYEGRDELSAGEARRLVEMLNKCAVYPDTLPGTER